MTFYFLDTHRKSKKLFAIFLFFGEKNDKIACEIF